jgi:hypothetical protein
MEDIQSIVCSNGKLYIVDSRHEMLEISNKDFLTLFSRILQLESGEMVLINDDKSIAVAIDEELSSILQLNKTQLKYLFSCGRNQDNDVYELVKSQGYEKEYCLIFAGHILFHSSSKEETDKYENEHQVAFLKYEPL